MMSIASWCVLEGVRDNPGSISPYAASSAAGEALAEIETLRGLLAEAQGAMPADLRTHRGLRDRINRALTE